MNPIPPQGLLPYPAMMSGVPAGPQGYVAPVNSAPNGGQPPMYSYPSIQQQPYPMMTYGYYPNVPPNYYPMHGQPPPPQQHHPPPNAPATYQSRPSLPPQPQIANPSKTSNSRMTTPTFVNQFQTGSASAINPTTPPNLPAIANEQTGTNDTTPKSQNLTNQVTSGNDFSRSSSANSLLTKNGRRSGWHELLPPNERKVVEKILEENQTFEEHLQNFEREFSKMSQATAKLGQDGYNSMWINWKDHLLNRRSTMFLVQEETLNNLYKDICQKYPLFSTQGILPTVTKSQSQQSSIPATTDLTTKTLPVKPPPEPKSSNFSPTQSISLTQTSSKGPVPAPVSKPVITRTELLSSSVAENKGLNKEKQAVLSKQEKLNCSLLQLFDGREFCANLNNFQFVRNEMKFIQKVLDNIRLHPVSQLVEKRRLQENTLNTAKHVTPPLKNATTHTTSTKAPLLASKPLRKANNETSSASTSKKALTKPATKVSTVAVSSQKSQNSTQSTQSSSSSKASITSSHAGNTKRGIISGQSGSQVFSNKRQDNSAMDSLIMREHRRTVISTKSEMNTIKVQVSTRKPKTEIEAKTISSERQVVAAVDTLSERANNIQVTIVNDRAKLWQSQLMTNSSLELPNSSIPRRIDGLGDPVVEPLRGLEPTPYFVSTYYDNQMKPETFNSKYECDLEQSLYLEESLLVPKHTSASPLQIISPTPVLPPKRARSPSPVPPPIGSRDVIEHEQPCFKSDIGYRNPEYFTTPRKYEEEPLYIQDILDFPARTFRPPHIVLIIRGLPGSGKSYTAFQIREREMKSNSTVKLRLLSYDYYFKIKSSGKGFKRLEYESNRDSEYKDKLYKEYCKTLTSKYSTFVIVDAVFEALSDVHRFYKSAIEYGYTPYIIEMEQIVRQVLKDQISISTQRDLIIKHCFHQNRHYRTMKEIEELYDKWELLPNNYLRLDAYSIHKDKIKHKKSKKGDGDKAFDSPSDDLGLTADYREHSNHSSTGSSRDYDRKRYRDYGESSYNESSYQFDHSEDPHYSEEPITNRYDDIYHESYDDKLASSPDYKRYRNEEERFSSRLREDSQPRFQSEYFQGSYQQEDYYDENPSAYYSNERRY